MLLGAEAQLQGLRGGPAAVADSAGAHQQGLGPLAGHLGGILQHVVPVLLIPMRRLLPLIVLGAVQDVQLQAASPGGVSITTQSVGLTVDAMSERVLVGQDMHAGAASSRGDMYAWRATVLLEQQAVLCALMTCRTASADL